MRQRRQMLAWPLLALPAWLGGCATPVPASRPMPAADWHRGLHLRRELPPEGLPDGAVPIPHAQFVLLPAQTSLGMLVDQLVPVPFVVDAVKDQINQAAARRLEAPYAGLDPMALVQSRLEATGEPALAAQGLDTWVFAFAQECIDDRYRFAVVAHLRTAQWTGRYLVHLPETLAAPSFQRGEPAALERLRAGMDQAATRLVALLQRATRGMLQPSGTKVDIGSLHLVGSKSGGLVSPTLLASKNVDLIEESATEVMVRINGDPKLAGGAGGLLFGVHLLPRDQLYSYARHA